MVLYSDTRWENYLTDNNSFDSEEHSTLFSDDISRICQYLENPTKSGFWVLELNWNNKGNIIESITEQLKPIIEQLGSQQPSVEETDEENETEGIQLSQELETIEENVNKLSFIFELFHYITYLDSGKEHYPFFRSHYMDNIIIPRLGIRKIKEDYSEAYDYFEREINFDAFYPIIYYNMVSRLKDDFIIATDFNSYADTQFKRFFISFNPIPLEKLQAFLSKIGIATDIKIQLVFSPEEKVFEPYITILKASYSYLIREKRILNIFDKSFKGYEDNNYEYCISNLGIIAEDYLTQVYETFFRESIYKKLSMGETYNLINSSIAKKFQPETKSSPNINLLYDKIRKLLEIDPSQVTIDISNDTRNEEILRLIRDVIYFIQEDKKYIMSRLDDIEKNDSTISVFPRYLKENITELIKYRNSISHNSRILIGQYEAQRAVFCCMTLLMWWMKEIDIINWKDDQDTIIKKAIIRNK